MSTVLFSSRWHFTRIGLDTYSSKTNTPLMDQTQEETQADSSPSRMDNGKTCKVPLEAVRDTWALYRISLSHLTPGTCQSGGWDVGRRIIFHTTGEGKRCTNSRWRFTRWTRCNGRPPPFAVPSDPDKCQRTAMATLSMTATTERSYVHCRLGHDLFQRPVVSVVLPNVP